MASVRVSTVSAAVIMGEIRAMADQERDGLPDDDRGHPDWQRPG